MKAPCALPDQRAASSPARKPVAPGLHQLDGLHVITACILVLLACGADLSLGVRLHPFLGITVRNPERAVLVNDGRAGHNVKPNTFGTNANRAALRPRFAVVFVQHALKPGENNLRLGAVGMDIQIENAHHIDVFDVVDGGMPSIRARQKRFFVSILGSFIRLKLITNFLMRFLGCLHSIIIRLA